MLGLFLAAASCLQSAVGFGFTLFALPLMLLTGVSLPMAVSVSLTASMVQRVVAVHKLRRAVAWREIGWMIAIAIACLPVGIWLLMLLNEQEIALARQVIGALILGCIALRLALRVKPREVVAKGWGSIVAVAAGVLTGLANIGGPPVVLWIHSHRWSNAKCRVTALALSLPLSPAQAALLAWKFGPEAWRGFGLGLAMTPAVLIGLAVGMSLGRRLAVKPLRALAFALLTATGLAALVQPIFAS